MLNGQFSRLSDTGCYPCTKAILLKEHEIHFQLHCMCLEFDNLNHKVCCVLKSKDFMGKIHSVPDCLPSAPANSISADHSKT